MKERYITMNDKMYIALKVGKVVVTIVGAAITSKLQAYALDNAVAKYMSEANKGE